VCLYRSWSVSRILRLKPFLGERSIGLYIARFRRGEAKKLRVPGKRLLSRFHWKARGEGVDKRLGGLGGQCGSERRSRREGFSGEEDLRKQRKGTAFESPARFIKKSSGRGPTAPKLGYQNPKDIGTCGDL